jgi:hypothetical protein
MAGKSGPERRMVQRRSDKRWEAIKPHHRRASVVTDTQRQAEDRGRKILRNLGGGELTTKGCDGRIRASDSVARGPDPSPPKHKR